MKRNPPLMAPSSSPDFLRRTLLPSLLLFTLLLTSDSHVSADGSSSPDFKVEAIHPSESAVVQADIRRVLDAFSSPSSAFPRRSLLATSPAPPKAPACNLNCSQRAGLGKCLIDKRGRPYCNCSRRNYNPYRNCSRCFDQYTIQSGCKNCTPGYYNETGWSLYQGKCMPCEGLISISANLPRLTTWLSSSILPPPSSSRTPPYRACQAACNATHNKASIPRSRRCNSWVFFGARASPAVCQRLCILYNGKGVCVPGVLNFTAYNTLVYWQTLPPNPCR